MKIISTNWSKLQSDREINARNEAFNLFKTCTSFSSLYNASVFNNKKLKWLEQESDDMSMYSTLPDPALKAIVKMVVKDVSKQSSLHEKVIEDCLNQFLTAREFNMKARNLKNNDSWFTEDGTITKNKKLCAKGTKSIDMVIEKDEPIYCISIKTQNQGGGHQDSMLDELADIYRRSINWPTDKVYAGILDDQSGGGQLRILKDKCKDIPASPNRFVGSFEEFQEFIYSREA